MSTTSTKGIERDPKEIQKMGKNTLKNDAVKLSIDSLIQTYCSTSITVNVTDVERYFMDLLENDKNLSAGIAAIKTLLVLVEKTNCKWHWHFSANTWLKCFSVDTIQELHTTIRNAVKAMRSSDYPITAVVSGSELFSRFITLGKFDDKTMDECKEIMVHRGQVFLKKLLDSRRVIAIKGAQYINDGCVSILIVQLLPLAEGCRGASSVTVGIVF